MNNSARDSIGVDIIACREKWRRIYKKALIERLHVIMQKRELYFLMNDSECDTQDHGKSCNLKVRFSGGVSIRKIPHSAV